MTVVVIGSGPAGAAAAHALCEAGIRPLVLDAGDRVEPERMEPFDVLGASEPERWPPGLALRARDAFPVDVGHVPLKPAYGSLFPYAIEDPDLELANEGAEALSSLAYGGLSNAWGAAMLPFRVEDIADWPVSLDELRPHYEAVLRFVPLAATEDELAASLPLYTARPRPLRTGEQARRLLEHMRRHRAALAAAGFAFGASRLAVVADAEDPRHCRGCGMCLYGCPYGSIYCSAHTFDGLARAGRIDYRGGVYVDRLAEANGTVKIHFHPRGRRHGGDELTASRVFVACGAISSTRLLLASSGRGSQRLPVKDSQYFVIPMLAHHGSSVSVASQGNTLSQVFVEMAHPQALRHRAHLQLYGFNDIVLAALAKRVRLPAELLARALQPLFGRLLVLQGFLHSADSPGLTLSYHAGRVCIVGEDTAGGAARATRVARRLAACRRLLGMTPITPMLHTGRPGKSNHLGGSLPMQREPRGFATDVLGRVCGWERVHVVDGAVLPSFPATTVTLSVMANAHRIASAAAMAG